MPISKPLRLQIANAAAKRGTADGAAMVEMLVDNWQQLQEKFNAQNQTEKEEMSEHFNMTVDGLADSLFGDDANIDDFRTFCDGLEDEEEKSFIKAIEEALLIEDP